MGKRNRSRSAAADYAVYLAVRLLICLIQAVPMGWGFALATPLGRLVQRLDRRHGRIAEDNLRHAFGDRLADGQREEMVRQVYVHFVRVVFEIAHIPRKLHLHNWRRYVDMGDVSMPLRSVLSDEPTIIVSGHFGNWEMAGTLLAALGMDSHAIARDLDNPYLHGYVKRFRQFTGQTILSKTGDFDRIRKVLDDGGVLISVADQAAGPRGYFVDYFGRPASTHKANAILAQNSGAALTVGYAYRTGPGFRYRVGASRVFRIEDHRDGPDSPPLALTREMTAALEAVVRRAPEQYLWLHNRWKHQPPVRKRMAGQAA